MVNINFQLKINKQKKMVHLILSFFVFFCATSLLAQDKTQLAIGIADAREKSTEQLIKELDT